MNEKISTKIDIKQVGGNHYKAMGIQPWECMKGLGLDHFEGYLRFNIIKYISRYPDKGGLEDLRKALHYTEKLITFLENKGNENEQN